MTRRGLGLALLLLAGGAYGGIALPTRRAAAEMGDEYRQARQRRYAAVQRLASAERRRVSRERAALMAGSAFASERPSLMDFRASVLASLATYKLSDLKLTVTPARSPVAARVHVSAEGSFSVILSLTGSLVRPGSGLVLDRIRLDPRPTGAVLDVEGLWLERRS